MTVIYCAQDKRKQAQKKISPKQPYVFASPSDQAVDHTATRVIIVGSHPQIAERYKGIARVELIELEQSKDEDK